jgi:4-amino-4-deoxy-L-arabinose transferase-like glycosyltransferase
MVSILFGSWKLPVLFALFEGVTHFGVWHQDSIGYVSILKFFRGAASIEEAQFVHWHGILRPVVPFLALPLSFVMSYSDAIATVNLGFFVVGTLFTYLFTKKLLGNEVAFVSAISYASAAPNLKFGTAILTDGPGYAMLIVLLYFVLFVLEKRKDLETSVLGGILIGIGVLTKETSLAILIFLLVRFLVQKDRPTVAKMVIILVVSVAIPLVWSQVVGYSYLGFYGEGLAYKTPGYKGPLVNPLQFTVSAGLAFYLCLPFAFLAFFTIDDERFKTLCEVLLAVGAILMLWPTGPEDRLTFLAFPVVLPLAALGMSQASQILAGRPWFKLLRRELWLAVIIVATVAATNIATFGLWFRIP